MSPKMGTEEVAAGLWEEIADTELTAPAATIDIPNIPAGYAVLLFIYHDVYGDNAGLQSIYMNFNGDGGNNYDYSRQLFGVGTNTTNGGAFILFSYCGNTGVNMNHANGLLHILNRAAHEKVVFGTDVAFLKLGGSAEDVGGAHVEAKWRNVAVEINRITLSLSVGNFVAGSRVILLGVPT